MKLTELPLALALKRLLGPSAPRGARPAPRARTQPSEPVAAADAAPPGHGPLALPALVALIVGCGLLILFDVWYARLLGVLALFAFIVIGVFAIATPALLDRDD
jgi:hypothetical protein